MAMNRDTLLTSVLAASGGKLVVKYNVNGDPLIMVRIPKFNLEDIDPALGSGPHPAFVVNGEPKKEIFIGAYQAIFEKNCAISIPGQSPKISVNFDTARAACVANGPGFHLMTAWEWAAIAMWCFKNGFQPRGNTTFGKSSEATYETGVIASENEGLTLGGSGPASWRHDNTFAGIADLVGNLEEWNDGLFSRDGRLYFPNDNNFTLPDDQYPASSIYLDASTGPINSDSSVVNGNVIINDRITHFSETPTPAGGDDARSLTYTHNTGVDGWRNTAVATTFDNLALAVRQKAAQLLIAPKLTSNGTVLFTSAKGGIYARNYGERRPVRGGSYSLSATNSGIAVLRLYHIRIAAPNYIGLRPAFIL